MSPSEAHRLGCRAYGRHKGFEAACGLGAGRVALRGVTLAAMLVALVAVAFPFSAAAEQASQPGAVAAAQLDAGGLHSCAVVSGGQVRCWGYGAEGQLGYANTATIGDNETPASAGPVSLGPGRTALAISAGEFHTCALLDNGSVSCWGFGGNGRLGYGNEDNIGDNETPGSAGPVDLGLGRTAVAISAGVAHSCALLDDGNVRCWGFGVDGRLGYGNPDNIGDNETPGLAGPVDLGVGRTARVIVVGNFNTCAVLDDGNVRCWGVGANGQLGYGNQERIGDDETPAAAGPVDLGSGGARTARAISAGSAHVCALLDDANLRCWGFGGNGRLGYGTTETIGNDETPGSVAPVDVGAGRTASAISVGSNGNACARLDDASVRCWGTGDDGALGYGSRQTVGDDERPASVGPIDFGAGRKATAVSFGSRHACARLDDASVRCWGYGGNGRLGYCNEVTIGDDETPAAAGPVDLGSGGATCPPRGTEPPGTSPDAGGAPRPTSPGSTTDSVDARQYEARRARRYRNCLTRAARRARLERKRLGSLPPRLRRRRLARYLERARRRCVKRFGRIPGRVTGLGARPISKRRIVLSFNAPGSDGSRAPAARVYLVKQSRRPIRGARGFKRAPALCKGYCRFPTLTGVGGRVTITVRELRPRTTYYYAIAARDNVSHQVGPRSKEVRVKTKLRAQS